ncbi:hypothetical protein SAMN05216174_113112 [Actinokineospora iranica]|uniref:Uncharacterized protein n=1 Tax=Actinokineospora iranica TaxID=1271860 RepID=A0A1G6VV09_9PSEU|nr:hypothetical protein SAMN05216174_113112 [Actinokineospora iranica]
MIDQSKHPYTREQFLAVPLPNPWVQHERCEAGRRLRTENG